MEPCRGMMRAAERKDGMNHSRRGPMAVFLTGAGLSADSGVRTFRGEDGYYQGIRAEEVMSSRTMKERPDVIHRFCDDRRAAMRGVEPNAAHRMIAALGADYGDRVVHLTQNIDGLAEAAGHVGTVHLHGVLTRMRSIGNSHVAEDIGFARYWDGDDSQAPERGFKFRCPKTNSLYRPDVVLFGDLAPEYAKLWKAVKNLRPGDVFVVIGTQGSVLPVARLASDAPCRTVLNNLHPSPDIDEDDFDVVMLERASVAAAEIEGLVRGVMGQCLEDRKPS